MANGIDWFRWHHGSVTDPKFQLVAKKAGVRLGDVLVVWSFILESASANQDRGVIGQIDFETLDFLIGAEDGASIRILDAMTQRGLISGDRIAKWEERQPKREDDTAAERKRRQREREHELSASSSVTNSESQTVTQSHAEVTQCHDREEKSREEKNIKEPKGSLLAANRRTRLPIDFLPSESGTEYAVQRGIDIERELSSFRNHHGAKGSTMVDWQAAWRTWVDKAVLYAKPARNTRLSSAGEQTASNARQAAEILGIV